MNLYSAFPFTALMLLGAIWMLALLGLFASRIIAGIDVGGKRFFVSYFSVLTLYISLITIDETVNRLGATNEFLTAIYCFETLAVSILYPLMTAYLVHCSGNDWRHSTLFRTGVVIWLVFAIMLLAAPFTNAFYYVTGDNELVRGPLYPVGILTMDAGQVFNVVSVIRLRDRLPKRYFVALLFGSVPMAIITPFLIVAPLDLFFGLAVAMSGVTMYGIILTDEVERYMGQQREIAHQRASIMVLQMRPHFIYNTMMSIYYLCRQDPDLAQQVTLDFTTYLRKNFTAIASEDLIPFSEELEHTRAYLAVERAQFEDTLVVEIDAPHTDFSVPPLTLQPIVENAVKHGMDPDSVLRVSIRTESSADGSSRIVVENTGADFAPADDGGPHTALANIRQRLEMMCDGTMAIEPREGGGTVVTVTV